MAGKYDQGLLLQLNTEEASAERTLELLRIWSQRLLRGSVAHFNASMKYERREKLLSVFNIFAAIIVLFFSASPEFQSMFTHSLAPDGSITRDAQSAWTLTSVADACLPFVALSVVLSSTYQYISQYPNRAARHKQAAIEFANLRRKIERYSVRIAIHPEAVHALNRTYNSIAKHHPLVPNGLWKYAEKKAEPELKQILEFFENRGSA
ncbi:SLATT domain-containing protein [Pseudooctadecabacter jejudonensis]|uniref:SMODS and SLOG-associating 2TM effector domain-containing protein n=1 Tax=Pseudooctadecabacter jejudonensis TaxID=1391910 RepID=A0A1Y5SNU3_9RHOB|nr:SLATT domain-containing protein [Pseudooctadecabacter jejudonensis]SLN43324.1 hypothetical protein PSJ8397_02214 [Pseudooctadecabacter jejudonensis]